MEKDISITSKNQNLSTYSRRNIRKWGCWLAYNLRHNLRERINAIPYNKRNQLIPNCKETIKLLNQYPFEISNLRNDKDIVKESDSDETIKEYENLLRQLIKLYKEIDSI